MFLGFIGYDDDYDSVDTNSVNRKIDETPIVSNTNEIGLSSLKGANSKKQNPVSFDHRKSTKLISFGLEGSVILGGLLQIPPKVIKFFTVAMQATEVVGHILKIPAQVTKGISIFQPLVSAFRWHPIINAIAAGLEGCGVIANSINHQCTTNFRQNVETKAYQAYFEGLKKIFTDPNNNEMRDIISNKDLLSMLAGRVEKTLSDLQTADHQKRNKIIAKFQEEIQYIEPRILDKLKQVGDAAYDIAYIESIKNMKKSLIKDHFSVNGHHLKVALERISNNSPRKNALVVKNLKLCLSDKIASDRLSILSGVVSGVASIVILAISVGVNPLGYVLAGVSVMIIIGKTITDVEDRQNFEKAMGMPVTPTLECVLHLEEYWEKAKKLTAKFLDFCSA